MWQRSGFNKMNYIALPFFLYKKIFFKYWFVVDLYYV